MKLHSKVTTETPVSQGLTKIPGGMFEDVFESTLNIGAGDILPLPKHFYANPRTEEEYFELIVNLDTKYINSYNVREVEKIHECFVSKSEIYLQDHSLRNVKDKEWQVILRTNYDAKDFLIKYSQKFDYITMYRFLEHISKNDVLGFLYLMSTKINIGGYVDIIVPDYKVLAQRILNENVNDPDFERDDAITTYELLNEPYHPHASIWTKDRLYKYLEFERRFKVMRVFENYEFDGCDVYLRCIAQRVIGR